MYEEINDLVDRALDQEEEAIVQLTDSFRPMILSRIRRIHPYSQDTEDLVASAHLILLECLKTYSRERKVPFVHFFHMKLQYFLWDEIKKVKKREVCLLDSPDEDGQAPVDDLTSDFCLEEFILEKEGSKELQDHLDSLPKREAQVLQLFYFHDLGLSEIAGFLGLSYQTIANTKNRALKRLRRTYANQQKTNPL